MFLPRITIMRFGRNAGFSLQPKSNHLTGATPWLQRERFGSSVASPHRRRRNMGFPAFWFLAAILWLGFALHSTAANNDFPAVAAILQEHCLDCHAAQDPENNLVLESFATLMKGGEHGPAIVPSQSEASLLVKYVEGKIEKNGRKRFMPPGKRKKLAPDEIAVIKAWIDAGAPPPPAGFVAAKPVEVPKIEPKVPPRRPINALAFAPSRKWLAAARYGEVEIISTETRLPLRSLMGHRGNVNGLVFSADGSVLFAASGEPAQAGEVRQWNVADGKLVHVFEGHADAIYSIALSPDGTTLATGSYDQKIKLWDIASGKEVRTLSGHNGAIFGLAFRPDGKILASASADRTVKLWDPATGERRDTLSQALKELFCVAFSKDGKRLFAAGADNRIRLWEISESAAANPLLETKFGHEGSILNLALSQDGKSLLSTADDTTVKIWDATTLQEKVVLEKQRDWAPALAFLEGDSAVVVGRADGSLEFYQTKDGKSAPLPKPELVRTEPRGFQRGAAAKLKLIGKHLSGLTSLEWQDARIKGELISASGSSDAAWIQVTASEGLPRGFYELSVKGPGGQSDKLKVYVDDLPQALASRESEEPVVLGALPRTFWGSFDKLGHTDTLKFSAKAGETIVFDVAAKSIGSKANVVLDVLDSSGRELRGEIGREEISEPALAVRIPMDGEYSARLHDLTLSASESHFYRVSIGQFPFVTGFFPLSVKSGGATEIELAGFNLASNSKLQVAPAQPGELPLPLNLEQFRAARDFKVMAGELPESLESEPNDSPGLANSMPAPGSMNGRLWRASAGSADEPDIDCFKFESKAGQNWIIETAAGQRGSPADTKVEILYPNGQPVEQVVLQAIRDSNVTFRGIDSNSADCRVENWQEMDLNEFLYLQGEIVKIFRMPQGPDSGFVFYTSGGKRRAYFDTTATAHALDELCYIVQPHPPGANIRPNGLPLFPIYFANDDSGDREIGADSRIHFTAPKAGTYVIRVSDSRGFGGPLFCYRLVAREAKPDFKVALKEPSPAVNRGSGRSFAVEAKRIDGFEGEIRIEILGLPAGLVVSTPLVIQAGHTEAKGTLFASMEAKAPAKEEIEKIKLTASAVVDGKPVRHDVNGFSEIKVLDPPPVLVRLDPGESISPDSQAVAAGNSPRTITIAPGQTVPAWLRVQRIGYDDLLTFTVENLPHGIIVDNIGLNGVLIPKGESERQIFITAEKWVPETERYCFAVENQAGRQTSRPVLLKVQARAAVAQTAKGE